METTPGELLREARERRGISQKRLAIRAGTTQSAISRIEKDHVSPTVETLSRLLLLLGEELELSAVPRESGIDRDLIRTTLEFTPPERVARALAFAEMVRRNQGVAGKTPA
jgi:transcriptional regulator with XRE-family HTH domain